jgi:hypothetical protein
LLREGSATHLKDVKAITDQAKDGSFTWTPDNDIKSGQTYAFQLKQGDQINYTALLKSSGKPSADMAEEKKEVPTGAPGTTSAPATQTSGSSQATQASQDTQTSQATQATQATDTTMTTTGSKALISSSANASGSPSSSAAATSTESTMATGTEVVNGKKASSTGSVQTGVASIPQYSVQLVMGVAGLLAYLV